MLYFRGATAIPHFRKEQLLTQILYQVPQVTDIKAHFIYFINQEPQVNSKNPANPKNLENPESPLTIQEKGILSDILCFAELRTEPQFKEDFNIQHGSDKKAMVMLVVPRFKNPSPWSSRVTDIAHRCHLKKIKRIECGIFYTIQASEKIAWKDQQIIASCLHDPITEQVLFTFQAATQIFTKNKPVLLQVFDVMQRGSHALNEANQQLFFLPRCLYF